MKHLASLAALSAIALLTINVVNSQQTTSTQSSGGTSTQGGGSVSGSGSATSSGSASGHASGSASSGGFATSSGSGSGFGFNAKPSHVILWEPTPGLDSAPVETTKNLELQQLQYLQMGAQQMKVVLSGDWRDELGGMSLTVFKTDQDAQDFASQSPFTQSGLYHATVKPFVVKVMPFRGQAGNAQTGRKSGRP